MSWSCDFKMGIKLPVFPPVPHHSVLLAHFFLHENILTFCRYGILTFGLLRPIFYFFYFILAIAIEWITVVFKIIILNKSMKN